MMVSVLLEIVCMTEMLTISSIFTSNILSGLLISRKTRMENINKNSLSKEDQMSPTTITTKKTLKRSDFSEFSYLSMKVSAETFALSCRLFKTSARLGIPFSSGPKMSF